MQAMESESPEGRKWGKSHKFQKKWNYIIQHPILEHTKTSGFNLY